ncbi:MAG: hypothetical protein GX496_09190 [Firmicutes bacterium]|uniref:Flagellar operon protein (TIGR03826 family) n=1 Tax=Geochorda subterranea TaxID=3109564 RepID=A0ABZ1BME6_9FIRM|nr:hypothetical protein [Limnochorda sp. LNt]NLG69715.1 hypothetical protein [Bacillota bacterium]WRP13990.1 hypothetical protein VLY81_11225 [Limnochorda sp. LNt]
MGVKNCARCGRLFTGVDEICPSCAGQEQAEFDQVRAYLGRHPGATVAEVSAQTGVAVAQIHRWVREGRLRLTAEQLGEELHCQRCGTPIDHGRFCPACLEQLARELSHAARPDAGKPPPGAPASDRTGGSKKPRLHTRDDVKRRFG